MKGLPALEEFHCLTWETILKRFHYRKPGLWVLGARGLVRAIPSCRLLRRPNMPAARRGWSSTSRSRRAGSLPCSMRSNGLGIEGGPVRSSVARIDTAIGQSRSIVFAPEGPIVANPSLKPLKVPLRAIMTLRGIAREITDFPATILLCIIWIVVFLAMIGSQFSEGNHPPWLNLMVLGVNAGHRFGDLALEDIDRGEVWRLVTSTFLHYSVLHISLNLLAFYQLGTLLESWYGKYQLIMIYGLTGAGGNLILILIRYQNGAGPLDSLGGWFGCDHGFRCDLRRRGLRVAHEDGIWLGWQMVFFMCLTALLGVVFPRYLDNWGHLGGAEWVALGARPSQVTPSRYSTVGLGTRCGCRVLHRGLWSGPGNRRPPQASHEPGTSRSPTGHASAGFAPGQPAGTAV